MQGCVEYLGHAGAAALEGQDHKNLEPWGALCSLPCLEITQTAGPVSQGGAPWGWALIRRGSHNSQILEVSRDRESGLG